MSGIVEDDDLSRLQSDPAAGRRHRELHRGCAEPSRLRRGCRCRPALGRADRCWRDPCRRVRAACTADCRRDVGALLLPVAWTPVLYPSWSPTAGGISGSMLVVAVTAFATAAMLDALGSAQAALARRFGARRRRAFANAVDGTTT
jgi:hypothetical protein